MDQVRNEYKLSPESVPTVSAILQDGSIVETVYSDRPPQTALVAWKDHAWSREPFVNVDDVKRLVPYSPSNNLISNKVVLLPSEPEEYDSENDLVREIEAFIHRYVDVTPLFEKIASYYVLLSWIYDGFNELPYLRLRGDR